MSNIKHPPTEKELKWATLYIKEKVSLGEIAERYGESRQRVAYALKKMKIKMRKRADYFIEPRRSV